MDASTLEEFYISIGVDADQLNDFQKAVLPMVQSIQKNLALLVTSFDDTTKRTSESQKKLGSSSSKMQKGLQDTAKKTQNIFAGLKTELLAFAGISLSIGGAVGFVTSMTKGVMQLSIQSKALGMSAKELDGWQKAAIRAGSTAQSITGALGSVQQQLNTGNSLHDYSGSVYQVAARLGLSSQVMSAHNAGDVMKLLMSRMRGLNKADQYQYGSMLGLDAAEIQSNQSGEFLPAVRRYTQISNMSPDEQRKAKQLNDAMTDLNAQFTAMKNTLYVALIPYAEKLIGYLNLWAEWINQHPKEVQAALNKIQKAIGDVVDWANKGVDAVGGWKNAIEILIGLKVASWVIQFTGAVRGLMGLGSLGGAGGVVGKLGVAGTVAAVSEPVIDKVLNYAFGNNESFQKIRTAQTWGAFAKAIYDALPTLHAGNAGVLPEGEGASGAYANVPFPLQHAQAARAVGKGKELLAFMSGQFGQLEAQYGLPAGLLNSVATTESGGNQFAQSAAGAKGLFQFVEGTAKGLGLSGNDVFDPQKSAQAAAKYLSQLLKHYHGNLQKTLAAYNWGIGNVDKYGLSALPGETSAYVPKVIAGMPSPGSLMAAQRNSVVNHRGGDTNTTTTHISIGNMTTGATTGPALVMDIQKRSAGTIIPYSSGQ